MGLGDKFKAVRAQAQQAVNEHREQIQNAVHDLSEAANTKTGGKHADKIMRFDQKATDAVDKFGDGGARTDPESTTVPTAESTTVPTAGGEEPEATQHDAASGSAPAFEE